MNGTKNSLKKNYWQSSLLVLMGSSITCVDANPFLEIHHHLENMQNHMHMLEMSMDNLLLPDTCPPPCPTCHERCSTHQKKKQARKQRRNNPFSSQKMITLDETSDSLTTITIAQIASEEPREIIQEANRVIITGNNYSIEAMISQDHILTVKASTHSTNNGNTSQRHIKTVIPVGNDLDLSHATITYDNNTHTITITTPLKPLVLPHQDKTAV